MIETFLEHASEIETVFTSEFPKKRYAISASDLKTLKEFVALTQVFQTAILRLQTDGITSSKCYGIFRELLDETSRSYSNPVLVTLANAMNELHLLPLNVFSLSVLSLQKIVEIELKRNFSI